MADDLLYPGAIVKDRWKVVSGLHLWSLVAMLALIEFDIIKTSVYML